MGSSFLVLRVCTVGSMFGTGVVVWVYCGKQFLVLKCVLWVALLILRGYVGVHVWYCGNKKIVGQGGHYGRTPCAAQKNHTEEGRRCMVLCEFQIKLPGAIPPPIPPPPWAKVQAQPLGRPALCPGGRGNGRGNSTRPTPSHTKNETSSKTEKKQIAHNLP